MSKIIPLLLSDTYKQTHDRQYPEDLEKLVSYWTPRKSMLKKQDKMIFFGLQAFIKKYLVEEFNDFFSAPLDKVIEEYMFYMDIQLGRGNYDTKKIVDLHNLGYLPLEIRAMPEGSYVNMGVPCIELTNTVSGFGWLVQWVECLLQVELWAPSGYATIGKMYLEIAKKFYSETVDDNISPKTAMADFGMRGMSCLEDSIKTSSSWLLSFDKTSTIPALSYIKDMYAATPSRETYGYGAVSTEHSVMGANYALDGDEITFVKKLLTQLYPETSFSMVSDTYDYWNMIENILPQCKNEIMNHKGKMLVRPDSGDIIEISIKTVEKLWDIFGGTINSKGYKVLDPHIGIIYGDGCTMHNVTKILTILKEKGFAANNIYFGVGAFCFHGIFEDDRLVVLTRDTFGIAMKATWGSIPSQSFEIFKDPKTDTSKLKKSHRGCCSISEVLDSDLNVVRYEVKDGFASPLADSETCLKKVFLNGKIEKEYTFDEIRERVFKA